MSVLVVQLGHCYRHSGATGTVGEQEYAAKVGAACARLLHGHGGWVVRQILADAPVAEYRGDAFFAIHCDGSTSASAKGASVGYRNVAGQQVAQAWKRAYEARGWSGFRPDNYTTALSGYYGTRTAVGQGNHRAVIVECGFRTNPTDRAALDGPGGPERVALAIGDALGIPHSPPLPDEPPTIAFQEDDMARFYYVKGDSTQKMPAPRQTTSYGDLVFLVEASATELKRRHIQAPELQAAVDTGAKVTQLSQAWVDGIPCPGGLFPWESTQG